MAVAVQTQWDIGNSVFAVHDRILGLLQAATVDDVQPSTVHAAEAIGWCMDVDSRLIGKAVDALGGDQSYRLNRISLQLGLSRGGIPSQVRHSPAAIKTFLLITALTSMEAWEIGNVLYEMLVQSKAIQKVNVSSKQLADLVASLQGHAKRLGDTELLVSKFQVPVFEKLALLENDSLRGYYTPPAANQVAYALLACFEAIREDDIHHINVHAGDSVAYLISIMRWLCPDFVEIFHSSGQVLIECPSEAAKIRIIVNPGDKDWRFERSYKISQPQLLVETVAEDEAYFRPYYPSLIPLEMTYHNVLLCFPRWSKQDLNTIGVLAFGLILAATEHGRLQRKLNPADHIAQTMPFRDICSSASKMTVENSVQYLGFPFNQQDAVVGKAVAAKFPMDGSELRPARRHFLMSRLDKDCMGGTARTDQLQDHMKVQFLDLAMTIAEVVLLRLTHKETPTDLPFRTVFIENVNVGGLYPILCPLLDSDPLQSLSATEFIKSSLLSLSDQAERHQKSTPEVLAVSCGGQVAYLGGFLETPQTPADAFKIIVQPGKIKWRDVSQDFLFGPKAGTILSRYGDPKYYEFLAGGVPVQSLPSLRNTNFRNDGFVVTMSPNGLRLQYVQASTGDREAKFSTALAAWALATRVQPSGKTLDEQIRECVDDGVSRINHKHKGTEDTDTDKDCKSRMGVATYGDNVWANLLRFGTDDASSAHLLIQGLAAIPECALVAKKLYGSGFIIMANP